MGYYINPKPSSILEKEDILAEHGIPLVEAPTEMPPQEVVPICLVDSGFFTAAGVAFCQRELEVFANPEDLRPKLWFLLPVEVAIEYSDWDGYPKEDESD